MKSSHFSDSNVRGLSKQAVSEVIEKYLDASAYPIRTQNMIDAGLPGGDGMQYCYSIAYSKTSPDTLFMSGDTFRIYKSIDGGFNWKTKYKGIDSNGVCSVIIDPLNSDIALAAAWFGGDKTACVAKPSRIQGIYRTINGGDYWSKVKDIDFFSYLAKNPRFAFVPSIEDSVDTTALVYAATGNDTTSTAPHTSNIHGLWRSTDNGANWEAITAFDNYECTGVWWDGETQSVYVTSQTSPYLHKWDGSVKTDLNTIAPKDIQSISVAMSDPKTIYAACNTTDRICKSEDYGVTWVSKGPIAATTTYRFYDVVCSPVDKNYVIFKRGNTSEQPWYTHDGGTTWTLAQSCDLSLTEEGMFSGGASWGFQGAPVAWHPTDKNILLTVKTGRSRVIKSIDGGINYKYYSLGWNGGLLNKAYFYEDGRKLFGYEDHGLFKVDKNGAFSEAFNYTFASGGIRAIDVSGDTIICLIGTATAPIAVWSKDNGETWSKSSALPTGTYKILKIISSSVVVAGTAVCTNFDTASPTFVANTTSPANVIPLYYDGSKLWGAVDDGTATTVTPLVSTDGVNYVADSYITATMNISTMGARNIFEFAVTSQNSATIRQIAFLSGHYAGLKVSAGAAVWTNKALAEGLIPDAGGNYYTAGLAVHPHRHYEIYVGRISTGAGSGNGLYRSKNGGATWSQVNIPSLFNTTVIISLHFDKYTGDLYLGTPNGTWIIASLI